MTGLGIVMSGKVPDGFWERIAGDPYELALMKWQGGQ